MSTLHRVVYCSRSLVQGSAKTIQREIDAVLAISRRRNHAAGVSGALLFTENWFAQVLEGPLAAVERTFERIQCDARHAEVTVIEIATARSRRFEDWSMAYVGGPGSLGLMQAPPLATLLAEPRAAATRKLLDLLNSLVTHDAAALVD